MRRWTGALCLSIVSAAAHAQGSVDLPALAARVAPGEGQRSLQPLEGKWRVTKSLYIVAGTPEKPVVSTKMTTVRKWVGDGRFLSDTTTGELGGKPYFRTGLLGFNNEERRYQWVTADNQTPILMSYASVIGTGVRNPIDLRGSFSDPGVTGKRNTGLVIAMRTHVEIVSNDRHVFEIWFTPPGQAELLADRMVFERIK